MIHIVGAGSGAPDLITVRGAELLKKATCIVYAGSLVNPALLEYAPEGCEIHDSAGMTLEEVIEVLERADKEEGSVVVRLHTGDPSLYGAIKEQIDILTADGFEYKVTPGVSSAFGAASSLGVEFTLPDVTQTLIISRIAGRTPVPESESPEALAKIGSSMVFFLSVGKIKDLCDRVISAGRSPQTPAAAVYKATWPEEESMVRGTLETLPQLVEEAGYKATTLIFIGDFLDPTYDRSKLYDPTFSHGFRKGEE